MTAREASREASCAHELVKHVAEKGQNGQGKVQKARARIIKKCPL
jgi:hypothetical protein